MRNIRVRVDISGTVGSEAWVGLNHFSEAQSLEFGPEVGCGGPCLHKPDEPHLAGEWWEGLVAVKDNFLAEYALPHYLEQPRVKDTFIEATQAA